MTYRNTILEKLSEVKTEKPVAKAVKTLIVEKPISSGWSKSFSREFDNISPRWAIVFKGLISLKAREAAKNAGLEVWCQRIPQTWLTSVSLPNVGETEYEKAEETFNRFAEEYKKLSNMIDRVLMGQSEISVIKTAYDTSKFIPGYSGKFVIQIHNAERAGPHWDFRIEWPVKSLRRALKKYLKRCNTPKPENKYPDKPGTVYRSFVAKKMKIPSNDTKIFLIETEDHPISYGSFEGAIPEGYGAGTVKIYDEGRYEVLDVKNSRYIIKFLGKKLNGIFALIKYRKGFLWVKVKKDMEKVSSIIDYPVPDLSAKIWDLREEPPKLRTEIRESIISELTDVLEKNSIKNPFRWIDGLYISGSMTSNNYKEDADLDIDIQYDPQKVKKIYPHLSKLSDQELHEYLEKIIYQKNKKNVKGTPHVFSFLLLEVGDMPVSEGVYDVLNQKWLRTPKRVPLDFDPDDAFVKERIIASRIARIIDMITGAILSTVKDLKILDQYEKSNKVLDDKRQKFLMVLKILCNQLDNWYNWIWNLPKLAKIQEYSYFSAFDWSPNWEFKNVIFKYLARWGYHTPILNLYKKMKGDPYLDIIDKFIPD